MKHGDNILDKSLAKQKFGLQLLFLYSLDFELGNIDYIFPKHKKQIESR